MHNSYYEKIGDHINIVDIENNIRVPQNWFPVRLGNLSNFITSGGTPSRNNKKYWSGEIPWLKISDIKSKYITQSKEFITEEGLNNSSAKIFPKGTLVYTIFATIGDCGILDFDASTNQAIAGIFVSPNLINTEYLYYYMKASTQQMLDQSRGLAQININQQILKSLIIYLPPLEEQHRIVSKIEELMSLVDAYEKYETVDSILDQELPEKLKKSILQYAIQGKLVKQDPNDEPASVLLERIKAEKEKLIKEGKIKRDKYESSVFQSDDKNYYENLPINWCITKYSLPIVEIYGGGTPSKEKNQYWNGNIPWCSVKDLGDSLFINDTIDRITLIGLNNSSSRIVSAGDIILCTRMAIGKVRIATIDMAINQDLKGIILSNCIDKMFFIYHVMANSISGTGTTVKGIQLKNFINSIFYLPPYKEQVKIAKKISILNQLI